MLLSLALLFLSFANRAHSRSHLDQAHFDTQLRTSCSREAGLKKVITPELEDLIVGILNEATVPGLTLGVVHSGGVEFGSWGKKTEEGTNMTTDVS